MRQVTKLTVTTQRGRQLAAITIQPNGNVTMEGDRAALMRAASDLAAISILAGPTVAGPSPAETPVN